MIVDAILEELDPRLGGLEDAFVEMLAIMKNGAGKNKAKPRRVNVTHFTALQKQARVLGINSYGMGTKELEAAIANAQPGTG